MRINTTCSKLLRVMANCKHCNAQISRLDKDVCPFCGGLKPLEGTDDSTQDITKVIGQVEHAEDLHLHSRVIAAILAFVFGIFGLHTFYLGKNKKGLITLIVSIDLIGGLGSLIYFVAWKNIFAYLIPYFILEFLMIGVGVAYLTKRNIVDSNGAFLK